MNALNKDGINCRSTNLNELRCNRRSVVAI